MAAERRAALPDRALTVCVALLPLGAGLSLATQADDAFEAPQRLIALTLAVLAAVLALWRAPLPRPREWSAVQRRVVVCVGLFGVAVVAAALAAEYRPAAFEALRRIALWSLLLPLGASLAGERHARMVWGAAALAIGANAALSLLQIAGFEPWQSERLGGRFPSGAWLGNEGYVALAAALALPACVALRGARAARLPLALLCVAAIVANRQATAAIAAIIGVATVLALQHGRVRALQRAAIAGTILLVLASLAGPAPFGRPLLAPPAWAEGQTLTTWRLGAWTAADRMWRARPLLGQGPGSYALQSQTRRLEAESALRVRLTPPSTATHFQQAHNDWLQLAAEAGLPALLAALAGFGLLLGAAFARARHDPETRALCGVLMAGGCAALAWFPLQIPLTAACLLLAAGRAWRRLGEAGPDETPAPGDRLGDMRAAHEPHLAAVGLRGPAHESHSAGVGMRSPAHESHSAPAGRHRGDHPGRVLRLLAAAILLALWWPEPSRYRAALQRAEAADAVAAALRGELAPAAAAQRALARTTPLLAARPDDARVVLPHALALLLAGRAAEAESTLQRAIALGERPELTLNLGRARAARGDEAGAQAAFLRAGWAAPAVLATLPALARVRVQRRVLQHEAALQRGASDAIPPLGVR